MRKVEKYRLRFINLIYDLSYKFPLIGKPLIIGLDLSRKLKFNMRKKLLRKGIRLNVDTDKFIFNKIILADPQQVDFYLNKKFNKLKNSNRILGGDWDFSIKKLDDLPINLALNQKFKESKNWNDTQFYQELLNQISNGIIKWGVENKEELDKKFKELELFYNQIQINLNNLKSKPYLSIEWRENLEVPKFLKDIKVNIGRDGELILIDGVLNLLIAKLLKIPKVSIIINTRHKEWVEFKKNLLYLSRKGWLYQILNHPDLQEFTYKYGDSRFNLIKENLTSNHGTLLDIGANFGFFCHKFEDLGFDCYAVEVNPNNAYFLEKLKKADNKKFKIINTSIFEYQKDSELNFDVALALNIFHHFLKRKIPFLNFIKLLKRLKVKELFFGPHNPKEFLNMKAYKNFTPEQFVNFIIENSCLSSAKLIGQTKNDRKLYRLTSQN